MNVGRKFLVVFLLVNIVMVFIYINNFEVKAANAKDSGAAGSEMKSKDDKSLLNTMQSQADNFIQKGEKNIGDFNTSSITNDFKGLGQILTMIGAGVMVAVVSYMGIKYIMSPPDKQAALKQQLIGVVVAGIVIFGAYGIWSAILSVVSKF